ALRALSGGPVRVEVYADDGTARAAHPYTVTGSRYQIVRVQPHRAQRPGVFRGHPLETVTMHYERDPADPRVEHHLVIEVDRFNTVRQRVAVGYPRRVPTEPEQAIRPVLWTLTDVAHNESQPYRIGVPVQSR